jgi:glycosyltransferase involved in cell wall biosynthesis
MIKLSVVIITLNEEKNIARCLKSVEGLADEVVVVDSFSTDKTKAICQEFGARFVEQKFLGYQDQKNFAHQLAQSDYVLSLDADEALSPELYEEIKKLKNHFEFDGYEFSRLTNYNGHWVKHCGWYPDKKLRLVKKNKAKWAGGNIHEWLEVEGTVGQLNGDLYHYSFDTISSHVLQTNKFSTIDAQIHYAKGKRASVFKLVTRPPVQFFKDYFLKLGILDGQYGCIICFINALYVLLKYAKMIDLEHSKSV